MAGSIRDGDARFARGMNTVADSFTLPDESYAFCVNMLNRGGVLQTRPGFDWRFTLPTGKLQALTTYRPQTGLPQLIAIVSGQVYASSYPYKNFRIVPGATMSSSADRVYTELAVKSVERNPDNSLRFILPKSLLMLQDGINPSSYYDGSTVTALSGPTATPQGTHMCWTSGRLWVARRNLLFASDIADPTTFLEQTFNTLGGIQYFVLPDNCTGLTQTPGVQLPSLLAFTETTTTNFRSEIRARASWSSIDDFQRIIFPSLGCIASRSITPKVGQLFWYSSFGIVRLDTAAENQSSYAINYLDTELTRSKSRLHSNLSGIAGASYENFLLMSVPNASRRNTHTWVEDDSVMDLLPDGERTAPAWASIWTGIRPVQYAKISLGGMPRLFAASTDSDGQNRVYQLFNAERRDNGVDIPWSIETRGYSARSAERKQLRWAEYTLGEISGQLDMKVSWAGSNRGPWKSCTAPTFKAREGNIRADKEIAYADVVYGLKKQSRVARTPDIFQAPPDAFSSWGVEGPIVTVEPNKEAVDSAFQFRIEGSGQVALTQFQVFMDAEPPKDTGQKTPTESDDHFVRFDGAASKEETDLDESPIIFTADKTGVAKYGNFVATATASATSTVSQSDADKRSQQISQSRAESHLRSFAPVYVGGSEVAP